jgi:hypothetical protein
MNPLPPDAEIICFPIRFWIKLVSDKNPDLWELRAARFSFLRESG